ncbi:MAG: hypothetical protein KatS3mg103_0506 [Phycisphaerales bacterium]|nr:MAG: hypothetical protein KatS3mg103_0506 [Phycisphaerales bacterium]
MRQSESQVQVQRELRTYTLERARPSEVAQRLVRVAEAMLRPADGTAYEAPQVEAIDELGQLVVRAQEGQYAVIEAIIAQLDAPDGAMRFVAVPVRHTTPGELLERVRPVYEAQAERSGDPSLKDIALTPDATAGVIVAQGSPAAVSLFQQVLAQGPEPGPAGADDADARPGVCQCAAGVAGAGGV